MSDPVLENIAGLIDRDDPTPVYHQLAAVIRWEVARGRLPIGAPLPPVRRVAAAVGVNYHTVRRAWGDLEAEGVISQRRGRGARVVRAPAALTGWRPAPPIGDEGGGGDGGVVWVADAALERAAGLAVRLAGRFAVNAVPYPLDAGSPPPGPIAVLATPAQAADLAARWPGREGDIHPIEPMIDPATVQVIRRNAQLLGVDQVAVVALAGDSARQVEELLRQLPRLGLRVRRLDGEEGDAAVAAAGKQLILHFPAAWQRLDWEARMHPRSMTVEYQWAAGPLARVARRLGWEAREG